MIKQGDLFLSCNRNRSQSPRITDDGNIEGVETKVALREGGVGKRILERQKEGVSDSERF
jgi:hypothetical protein